MTSHESLKHRLIFTKDSLQVAEMSGHAEPSDKGKGFDLDSIHFPR